MAMPRKLMIPHDAVFPHGAYLVGLVEPIHVFNADRDAAKVQEKDKDTDLPLWSVQVIDNDPDARKKTVTVKIAAKVQPVPPKNDTGGPFALVEFENLTVLPYVASSQVNGRDRHSVAWAFRATGFLAEGED